MTLDQLKSALPDAAKDLRLNLSSLAQEEVLPPSTRAGVFIATALAARNAQVIASLYETFAPQLGPEELRGAETAAALMAMNNVYYRAVHLMSAQDYGAMPAKLRMTAMANPGAPKDVFELWCLAVSAVNGCGLCLDSHEKVLRQHGVAPERVQAALRIAAVVHAVSVVLDGEAAKAPRAQAA